MLLKHPIPPLWDNNSKILILGSFPSVKSRETMFFYGHPQNRFWKVLANVLKKDVPVSIEDKKTFLLSNNIAVWDVIASCDIIGSSDASIKNAIPNDLEPLLTGSCIDHIFVNGKAASKLYEKHMLQKYNIKAITLPSTSPANAAWTLDKLINEWSLIKKYL